MYYGRSHIAADKFRTEANKDEDEVRLKWIPLRAIFQPRI